MDPVTKQQKIRKYKDGTFALWLFAGLSIVNVFLITYFDTYFLFSSHILTLITSVLKDLTEVYVSLIVALIFMVPCIICAIFAPKRYGFMIAGLVFISLDTLFLVSDVVMTLSYETLANYAFDIVCHVAAIVIVAMALKNKDAIKLMKLGFNENSNVPDSLTSEVLPSGETVMVLDDTDAVTTETSETTEMQKEDLFSDYTAASENEETDKDKKRLITIIRPKNFYACLIKFEVVIDGVVVGVLKNGGLLKVMLSNEAHALYVQVSKGNSEMLQITSGDQDKNYSIKPVAKAMGMNIEISEI